MVKERTRKMRFVFKASELRKSIRVSGFRDTQKHEERRDTDKKPSKNEILRMLED